MTALFRSFAAVLLACLAGAAFAQGYPAKPVRIIVPFHPRARRTCSRGRSARSSPIPGARRWSPTTVPARAAT